MFYPAYLGIFKNGKLSGNRKVEGICGVAYRQADAKKYLKLDIVYEKKQMGLSVKNDLKIAVASTGYLVKVWQFFFRG